MRTFILKPLLILSLLFPIIVNAQPPLRWQKSLGGTNDDIAYSIEQTTDGGYIVAGLSNSNDNDVSGNHNKSDFWVIKLDNLFAIEWQKCLGGTDSDDAYDIQQTSDGGYIVVGESYSIDGDITTNFGLNDCWVVKLTSTGNLDWEINLGSNYSDNGRSVVQTSDGGFIIAGSYTVVIAPGSMNEVFHTEYFITKLSSSGAIIWQNTVGGDGNENAYSIIQTTDGGYLLTGSSDSYNTGSVNGSKGGMDAWVVKLNSNGSLAWQKPLGGSSNECLNDVKQTADGGYILTGWTVSTDGDISSSLGGDDLWVVKLSSTGLLEWENSYGGSLVEHGESIELTDDGGVVISGYTHSTDGNISTSLGGGDVWIIKIDISGNLIWEKSLGGSGNDIAHSIIQIEDDSYVFAGETMSTNGDITNNLGARDYWIGLLTNRAYSSNVISATCPSTCDGSITITPFDSGPFTYDWAPGNPTGDGTNTITNLCPGTYYLTLIDNNLSTTYNDTFVIGPDPFLPNEIITHITCNGLTNGSIVTNATGGNMPYGYSWNVGGTGSSVSSLDAGLVILTTIDNNSCVYVDSFYVNEPNVLSATANVTHVSCFGFANGSVTITPQGGTAPYSYVWSNGSTTQNISNLTPNVYQLTITDANGCTFSNSYTITQPTALNLTMIDINTNCGAATGSSIANIVGGTTPYSFQWTNGDNTNVADSLAAGLYQVTITDANGCIILGNSSISDINGPVITLDSLFNVSCFGGEDGAIYLTVTGGVAPLDVYWLNGDYNLDQTGLPAGSQEVSVVDANGCTTTEQFSITQPNSLNWNEIITNADCNTSNGQITINPTGGTSPYSLLWNNNSTSTSLNGLSFGVYSVVSTDANGCLDSTEFSIIENGSPIITVDSVINPSCIGGLGGIYTTVSGPGSPYTLSWSNGPNSDDNTNIDEGTYVLQAVGSTGCTSIEIVEVNLSRPSVTPICIVTVDSTLGANTITWEKTGLNNDIAYFKILRESSQIGVYYTAGIVPFDSLSFFIDSASNPAIKSYRYKLVTVDTCGIESEESFNHKTIHLTANLGVGGVVNLIWDHYEGFSYTKYYIERYHSSTGWVIIDSVNSSANSFTDLTPPNGFIQYAVYNKAPYNCNPTRSGVNTSRSNIKNQSSAAPTYIYELDEKLFTIAPNPTNQFITVYYDNNIQIEYEISVFDISGALMEVKKINNSTIDISSLSNGVYLLKIKTNGSSIYKKLQLIK